MNINKENIIPEISSRKHFHIVSFCDKICIKGEVCLAAKQMKICDDALHREKYDRNCSCADEK